MFFSFNVSFKGSKLIKIILSFYLIYLKKMFALSDILCIINITSKNYIVNKKYNAGRQIRKGVAVDRERT